MSDLPNRYRVVLIAVAIIGVNMIINPAIVSPHWIYDPVGDGILIAEGLLGFGWIAAVCAWVIWKTRDSVEPVAPGDRTAAACGRDGATGTVPGSSSWHAAISLTILAAWLMLHRHRIRDAKLGPDDDHYLSIAQSWRTTFDHIFTPYNEHLCVFTRLYTRAIVASVAPDHLVTALAIAGMALFAATCVALYAFIRFELDSVALGLVAVSLFALTPVHDEVIEWYAASQWCWSLLILLVCLNLVRPAGSPMSRWRVWCGGLLSALAPLNFAVGLFVGPIATLYLVSQRVRDGGRPAWSWCAVPLIGTVVCAAVLVPLKSREIIDRADYGGRTPAEAVSVLGGALHATRATVDLLTLHNLGFDTAGRRPRILYAILFPLLAFAAGELVLKARNPSLPIAGCGLVIVAYTITLPFRAWVPYEDFVQWTRYQLFPHLGVVFIVVGALAAFGPGWLRTQHTDRRQLVLLVALISLQFLVHGLLG